MNNDRRSGKDLSRTLRVFRVFRGSSVALAATLSLAAQTAQAQDQDFGAFRDSINRVTDTLAIKTQIQNESANDRASLLRRGFLHLRMGELRRDKDDAASARKAFEQAVRLDASDAWAEYGIAMSWRTHSRVADPRTIALLESAAEILKRDPVSRAFNSLQRALGLQPDFTAAALELAALAIETRNQEWLSISRTSLERLAARDANAAAKLAQVNMLLGDAAGAKSAADIAATHGGPAAGEAAYARARTMLRDSATVEAGAAAYFAALDMPNSGMADLVFRDVQILLTEDERTVWATMSTAERSAFVKKFWNKRAATSGVTAAERLAEHYKRLDLAYERYRRSGKRGAQPLSALSSEKFDDRSSELDDRGVILIRHGEPKEVVRMPAADLRPFETWVYAMPDGKNHLYHFVKLANGTEFFLVSDIFAAVDATTTNPPLEAVHDMLSTIGRYDQRYSLMASKIESLRGSLWSANALSAIFGGNSAITESVAGAARTTMMSLQQQRDLVNEERRESARAALVTDTHVPRFEDDLPFYYDVYTFKGASGNTDVTTAIAIPGHSLSPVGEPGNFIYGVDLSIIVADSASDRVSRKDTTFQFRSRRQLGRDEYMRVHADLGAPAAKGALHRVIIRDANHNTIGQLYAGVIDVPDYKNDSTLQISDVILAEPSGGTWRRGSVDLAFVPPRQFETRAPARLFYEVYNMPQGVAYRTEITIRSAEKNIGLNRLLRRRAPVSIKFEGVAAPSASGVMQELRQISSELKPGRYKVELKVTNLTNNETAERVTEFVVID